MTIRHLFTQLNQRLNDLKHWKRLRRLYETEPRYQSYLHNQLQRSLSKRHASTGVGARLLIDKIMEVSDLPVGAKVLCIGCRNSSELVYFESRKKMQVIGLDLFSNHPQIIVMDMHRLTFPDSHFDVIFSSHSLEHSYDAAKVAQEIIRVVRPQGLVAIEVPVKYQPIGEDLLDFQNIDGLLAVFQPHVGQVLWAEEQPPLTPRNQHGNIIIRIIFSVHKPD